MLHEIVLDEMLDRLTTSTSIFASTHAQFAKERQNSIIVSLLFFLGWFRSIQQLCLLTISYTLIMDNITKYYEFCAKNEASSTKELQESAGGRI